MGLHASRSLVVAIIALTAAGLLVSPDPLLVALAGGSLALGIFMLWPVKDAPILVLPFAIQWVSVGIKPIQTALTGRPIDELSDFGEPLQTAALFAIAGVLAFGAGLALAGRTGKTDWAKGLILDAQRWDPGSVVKLTLAMIVLGHILDLGSAHAGSARQILLAFAGIRHAGLFILAYWGFSTGSSTLILISVCVVEIVVGMTGFFAGFRESMLVLVIAAAAARPRFGFLSILAGTVALTTLLTVTIFWSSVKQDYRGFVNQGTGQQVVAEPWSKRAQFLADAVATYDAAKMQDGITKLIKRTSYVDFLAKTIENVPANVDHQNGKQVGEALLHLVTPRILFPNKPPTPDDTVVTATYTGMNLQMYSGASISIGYLGELYIDFGFIGGIVGSFLLGLLGGAAYRALRAFNGIPYLMTYGLTVVALLPFSIFESALIKLLGSCVTVLIATFVLQRVLAPAVLPGVLRERILASPT